MRIELDLPDWVDERHIYVMAGIELAAYRIVGKSWMVKTNKCSECGKCCEEFKKNRIGRFPPTVDGKCVYLKNDGKKKVCSLGINRPFKCCVITPSCKGCSVKYKEVK